MDVQQPQLRSDLIAKGKSCVTKFDWKTTADQYAEAIRELLDSRHMLVSEIESRRTAQNEATKSQAQQECAFALVGMNKQMFKAGKMARAFSGFDEVQKFALRFKVRNFPLVLRSKTGNQPVNRASH